MQALCWCGSVHSVRSVQAVLCRLQVLALKSTISDFELRMIYCHCVAGVANNSVVSITAMFIHNQFTYKQILQVDPSPQCEGVFQLFDYDRSGQIDVREFMISLANFSGATKVCQHVHAIICLL